MSKRLYERVETLLYDPVAANRNLTRASLHALGFTSITLASSLDAFLAHLSGGRPDLILCEMTGAESEICDTVQRIRLGKAGNNPFVVLLVTTWRRDPGTVTQILNSGADDLLPRPFSTAVLQERIRMQIERRRGFVVTTDYVGPHRRRDRGRGGTNTSDVPNSLRIKMLNELSREEAEGEIEAGLRQATERLHREKLRRDVFQLCVQWRLLEQRYATGRDFPEVLLRIDGLCEEIRARADKIGQGTARKWCEAILESTRAILTMLELSGGRMDGDQLDLSPPMQLLGQASLSLGQVFAPGDVEPSALADLDALVARIEIPRSPSGPRRLGGVGV